MDSDSYKCERNFRKTVMREGIWGRDSKLSTVKGGQRKIEKTFASTCDGGLSVTKSNYRRR